MFYFDTLSVCLTSPPGPAHLINFIQFSKRKCLPSESDPVAVKSWDYPIPSLVNTLAETLGKNTIKGFSVGCNK